MEYSLGILKPDCMERNLSAKVLAMIKSSGLAVISTKVVKLTPYEINIIYDRCRQKDFFEKMTLFLLSGKVLIFIVKGNDAINVLNDIVGDTDPQKARGNTIRGTFGESLFRNICHSSMNEESFWKEIRIFFNQEELNCLKIINGRK